MADRIQFRRGTASSAVSANAILEEGEPGFETDTGKMKIGDGETAWNTLPYFAGQGDLPNGWYAIDNYGATHDGYEAGTQTYNNSCTENTAKFNQAIADAGGNGGGNILVGAGVYMSDELVVPQNVKFHAMVPGVSGIILKKNSATGN